MLVELEWRIIQLANLSFDHSIDCRQLKKKIKQKIGTPTPFEPFIGTRRMALWKRLPGPRCD